MNCIQANIHLIEDIIQLINLFDEQEYGKSLDVFEGASVGKHIRHVHEFYKTIVDGLQSNLLDYSDRARDQQTELNSAYAVDRFLELITMIKLASPEKALKVLTDFDCTGNSRRTEVVSSYGRELMYAYDHAIHHLAIIKIGMKLAFPHINLSDQFGMAPSSIQYANSNQD